MGRGAATSGSRAKKTIPPCRLTVDGVHFEARDRTAEVKARLGVRRVGGDRAADARPRMLGVSAVVDPAATGVVGPDNTFRVAGLLGSVLFDVVGVPPQWMLKAVTVDGVDVTNTGTDAMRLGRDSQRSDDAHVPPGELFRYPLVAQRVGVLAVEEHVHCIVRQHAGHRALGGRTPHSHL